MADNRSYLFDNIKAVLIFSTVFAHFLKQNPEFSLDSPGGTIYFIIFAYIMQGFFFVSGYFSRNLDKCRDTAVKSFLIPYIAVVILVSVSSFLICGKFRGTLMRPSFALWFLLAMFVYRVSIKYLVKIPKVMYLSVALYFISGVFPFLDERWAGSRICCFLMFYLAGYFTDSKKIENVRKMKKPAVCILAVVLVLCAVFISRHELIMEDVLFLKRPYEDYSYTWYQGMFVRAFIAVYFFLWMVLIIRLCPDRKCFFSEIGQRTITVYLLHIPVRYAFMYTSLCGSGGIDSYITAILLAVIITWLFSQKKVFNAYNTIVDYLYLPVDFIWQKLKIIKKQNR